MTIRVLVLTADHPPRTWSGIGTAVATQTAALARRGVEVDVLAPTAASGPVRVHRLDSRRLPVSPNAFDVVHLHSLPLAELALQLQARFGLPLVYTAHTTVQRELGQTAWSGVQAELFRRADAVVFPSADELDCALRAHPVLHAKCLVLPNGVPPQPPAHGERGPVLFAGRFTRAKGVDVLASAFDLLAARPDVALRLAGGHGDDDGDRLVEALVRRSGGRHRSLGWLPQPLFARLYSRAALVVVPSRYEPFGLVAREALAAGAPVLASAAGGLRELDVEGSGALVLGSLEPSDWAAAILRLVGDSGLRARLGREGPRFVAERYDPDRLVGVLVRDVYDPLLARGEAAA